MAKRKYIKFIGVGLAYLISLCVIFFGNSSISTKITSVVVAAAGFILFLYDNTDIVFKFFLRAMSKVSRDTVSWKSEINFMIDEESDLIQNWNTLIIPKIEEVGFTVSKNIMIETSQSINFTANYTRELPLDYKIIITNTGGIGKNITITSEMSCSYKDSKKFWNSFARLCNQISNGIGESNVSENGNKKDFSFIIKVDEGKNPFYKISVSHLNAKIKYFQLHYQLNEHADICVTKNTLEVKSNDPVDIENLLKDYVILSQIG